MKPSPATAHEATAEPVVAAPSVRLALISLALSMLLSSLGVSIANVALPTLAHAFAASFQSVQWIVLAYLLAVTTLIVAAGRLGDVMGHRRVLLAGIVLFTAASVLCGVALSLPMLIAARFVQGLGAAVLMALTIALVRESVPKERTGSAMGLLGTMSAIGTALGPSLGGVLIAGPGWRAIFLVMVPLGIANFLLACRHLPAGAQGAQIARGGFDAPGTVLLGLTLAAYALAMTVGARRPDLAFGLLAAVLLGAGLFVCTEARAASPLMRPALFRDRTLSGSLFMNALVSTVMMATLVVGPFYLSRALGLDPAQVGLVMSIGPVISALSGVPAGRFVDRCGAPAVVIIGLAGMTAGAIALSAFAAMFGVAGYIAAIALLTPGYQLFQAGNNTLVMMDVEPDQRGVVSGMLSLSRNLGLITGASLMGAVFAAAAMTADIMSAPPEAITAGMRITFAVASALVALALGIAIRVRRSG